MIRGDIILFENTDWFGKLITLVTGGKYSHVAIYWGKGKILEISPLHLKVIPLSKKKSKDYDIYRVPSSSDEIEPALKQTKKMINQAKWYDIFNALFFLALRITGLYKKRYFFKMFENKKGVICSEVSAYYLTLLKLRKKKWLKMPGSLITPSDTPEAFYIYRIK